MLRRRKGDIEPRFPSHTAKTFFVAMADEHHARYEDYRTLAVHPMYQAHKLPLTGIRPAHAVATPRYSGLSSRRATTPKAGLACWRRWTTTAMRR